HTIGTTAGGAALALRFKVEAIIVKHVALTAAGNRNAGAVVRLSLCFSKDENSINIPPRRPSGRYVER
ncbi:hypothetical protein ABTD88_19365, partial [Acinetobacter baumannii]